jgi:hypothetical protein
LQILKIAKYMDVNPFLYKIVETLFCFGARAYFFEDSISKKVIFQNILKYLSSCLHAPKNKKKTNK